MVTSIRTISHNLLYFFAVLIRASLVDVTSLHFQSINLIFSKQSPSPPILCAGPLPQSAAGFVSPLMLILERFQFGAHCPLLYSRVI